MWVLKGHKRSLIRCLHFQIINLGSKYENELFNSGQILHLGDCTVSIKIGECSQIFLIRRFEVV